jgi:hypothetical protein
MEYIYLSKRLPTVIDMTFDPDDLIQKKTVQMGYFGTLFIERKV